MCLIWQETSYHHTSSLTHLNLAPYPTPQIKTQQVNRDYKCKEPRLQPLLREVVRLLDKFDSAEVRHVYR